MNNVRELRSRLQRQARSQPRGLARLAAAVIAVVAGGGALYTYFYPLPSASADAAEVRAAFDMCVRGRKPGPEVNCVVDGDTFWFRGEKMRLRDIDTPETTTNLCGGQREVALGKQAGARLRALMNGTELQIERDGTDRYGRTLVTVKAGGKDVGQTLVDERLARLWPNGAEWWCD